MKISNLHNLSWNSSGNEKYIFIAPIFRAIVFLVTNIPTCIVGLTCVIQRSVKKFFVIHDVISRHDF